MRHCLFVFVTPFLVLVSRVSAQDTLKATPFFQGWKFIKDTTLVNKLVSKEDSVMPSGVPTYEVDNCLPRLSESPSGERRLFMNECLSQKFYRISFVSADVGRPVRVVLVILFTDKTSDLSRADIRCEAWFNEGLLGGRSDDVFVLAMEDRCRTNNDSMWHTPFLVKHFQETMTRFARLISKR